MKGKEIWMCCTEMGRWLVVMD